MVGSLREPKKLKIIERLLDFSQLYVISDKWAGKFKFSKLFQFKLGELGSLGCCRVVASR